MSDFLAFSFDCQSSPSIKLNALAKAEHSLHLGWGVGWYPHDDYAAMLVKDAAGQDPQMLVQAINDWKSFRSTVFLCKVKGQLKGHTQHDTQPFRRSFGGRDWLFMHNGELNRAELGKLLNVHSGFLVPVGTTDSEQAFCFLLGKVATRNFKALSEVPVESLQEWFQELDRLGSADLVVTDGSTLVAYHGTQSPGPLYFGRRLPSRQHPPLLSEPVNINLSDPRDTYRTVLAVSSVLFPEAGFHALEPGQMIVARRGALVWSSHPESAPVPVFTPAPESSEVSEPKIAFSSALQEQAQMQTQAPVDLTVINIKSITQAPDGKPLGFRLYDLIHLTEYQYSQPVEHSTHTYRLHPVEDQIQEIIHATLKVSVPGTLLHYEDVFGNQSIHYSIDKPYTQLQVESKSRIKVYACPPDDYTSALRRASIPLVWMPWQRQMMLPYLLPPELPESQLHELTDYAMSFVDRNDGLLLDTLHDINRTIYTDFQYTSGSTKLETTPFDIYASRQGVCQDFANLFICLTRLLNMPSRYRMGYIYTGGDYENKIQSEASHAWAEVYLPYLGWRGFDPTNGCVVGQDHVRVACGRNYIDATPTNGTIYKGGGVESLRVEVKITEVSG